MINKVVENELLKNYLLSRGYQKAPDESSLVEIVAVWVNELMTLDKFYNLSDDLLVKAWAKARKETEFPSFTDVARAISLVSAFEKQYVKRLK